VQTRQTDAESQHRLEGKHIVIELVRTNDLVLISALEALLTAADIGHFVADGHMSALEGSVGFLQRRIMVEASDLNRARQLLIDAGYGGDLKRD